MTITTALPVTYTQCCQRMIKNTNIYSITTTRCENAEGSKKCIHTLIQVIYGYSEN
jgi:GTP-dependent phosphoenolpyruvate carboxykinase